MKRVLIVSPYFPPSTLAGVHRARILAKHLPACGWEPVVFCVHERYHEQYLDHDLAALVPSDTRVIKVGAWPTRLSRTLGIGDLGIRGYGSLRRAVRALLDREGANLLFITALPGFPLLMGPGIKRKFGIPFIADFQDPWLPQDYRTARPLSKLWAACRIAVMAEPHVLSGADHVTSVSQETNTLIRSRYPWIPADRFSAVPIGGDEADFDYLMSRDRPCPWIEHAAERITFAYVGNIWSRAFSTLEAMFAAIATLKAGKPQLYERLRFLFIGTSNQPVAAAAEVVMPFARQAGIADIVMEVPRRVPYLDALNILVRADALLMVGSDEPHYTASKLYPVLLAKRPLLGVFHEASSVCAIAEEVGGVQMVKFGSAHPVETKVAEIARAIETIANKSGPTARADFIRLAPYLGPAITRRFADIFERVLERSAR